jgi:cell division protein FtsI (penicillin-binding protein 3)
MENKGKSKSEVNAVRMTIVRFFVLLLGLACLGQILYLSIFERSLAKGTGDACIDLTVDNQKADADTSCNCFVKANTLRPQRGEIYDDHGRLLMGNYTVFEIAFDGKQFAKEYATNKYSAAEVDNILKSLSADFYKQFKDRYPKYTEQHYYSVFTKNYKKRQYVTIIPVKVWDEKLWVTSIDTSFLKNRPYLMRKVLDKKTSLVIDTARFCRFLNFVSCPVRINPYGEMARRTLGFNTEGRHYGLEYYMDNVLAGEKGSKKYLELNHAVVPLNERLDPVDGYNIHTTLNLEIQNIVHNELSRKLQELNAEWGCVIVMETATGAVKAVSNLRRASKDGSFYNESMEYALNAKVEPGSTFKLASLLAFLEKKQSENKKDTAHYPMFNHTFKVKSKSGYERAYPKSDSKTRGEAYGNSNEIFQRSSNIGIASMIFDAYGMRNFASYKAQLAKFGFFDTIHTQLGDLMPAGIRNDGRFDNYYATCFGAGFNVPVLRTLIYYNAIANNGKMLAPLFVKYVTNDYDTLQTYEAEVLMEHFVSEATLKTARRYLDSVVWGRYGTGRHFKDSTCPFAGKTGTRDIWDADAKAYNYDRNAVSFCGYFPKEKPKYTAIVYIYNVPQHSEVAVDVFSKIARNIMNSNNFSAMHSITEYSVKPAYFNSPVNKRYFNVLLHNMGYDTVAYETKAQFLSMTRERTSARNAKNPKYAPVVKTLKYITVEGVPDVKNMIASDAVATLTRAGYKVAIHGRGTVKAQVCDTKNRTVKLYLE